MRKELAADEELQKELNLYINKRAGMAVNQ